jgi:hypothetical protein
MPDTEAERLAMALPDPAGFRTRYRSEPGMIGHYPWTYADQRRRRVDRPEHETEDLYTAEQVRAILAAELRRLAAMEADALRYRWLRSQQPMYFDGAEVTGEVFDATIDSARAQGGKT